MISVKEATEIILNHPYQPVKEIISVHHALGRILVEEIVSDTDLPPFDRIMMDGIAIRSNDWNNGAREFTIAGIQKAGSPALELWAERSCFEVMTGSICPLGTDIIIPYEEISIEGDRAIVTATEAKSFQHIHKKGNDKKKGEVLVKAGVRINAAHIAIAVSAGKLQLGVASLPRIHIFSTGDELVEIDQTPEHFQIRRSNVYALQQLLSSRGIPSTQSHLADDEESIRAGLKEALELNDVILLSGGVSKGKFDLIPDMLKEFGAGQLFHRIAQKPGKPMWFGTKGNKVVFAFPGNPVSTFMCAVRYFLPWLQKSCYVPGNHIQAKLASSFQSKTALTFFLQVKLERNDDGTWLAWPVLGSGSGDYSSLAEVNGFAEIKTGSPLVEAGQLLDCYIFD